MFATESAPGLAISGITGGYLLKLIVALGSVLLVFFLLALLTKKFHRFGQPQHRDLSVVSSMSVGTRERLLVVQVGDAQLLLGVTPSRIDKLFVLETPLPGSARTTATTSTDKAIKNSINSADDRQRLDQSPPEFRQKLNQFLGKKGRPT